MGRYTTVQAYADNNPTMRLVSYDQAVGKLNNSTCTEVCKAVRPEKVINPYGSTAGAGSGEFHIYRHARAREQYRLKIMHEEEKNRNKNSEYENKIYNWKLRDFTRTQKLKKKRTRQKEAKKRKRIIKCNSIFEHPNDYNEGRDFVKGPDRKMKEHMESNTDDIGSKKILELVV